MFPLYYPSQIAIAKYQTTALLWGFKMELTHGIYRRSNKRSMSTFYATFQATVEGFQAAEDLLRQGVPPENISLIADFHRARQTVHGHPNVSRLGDASYFVGGPDDPEPSVESDVRRLIGRVPRDEFDQIGGPDTSNETFDVESIDQSDDSQEMAEETLYPFRGESYGSREASDRRNEMKHNLPTKPDARDDPYDAETPLEDQNVAGFETLSVPGRGTIAGGGSLAAAAIDILSPEADHPSEQIYRFLIDDGVPRPTAELYKEMMVRGSALMAVEITPGRTDESLVEQVVRRHEGRLGHLFDAHRFHERGGSIHEDVGGTS